MRYTYPYILHPEEGGGFYVSFPDVRGALTNGADRAEALEMAEDALRGAMGGYVFLGRDIPAPIEVADGQYPIALPPVVAAKLALYTAMREQGISHADLAERLGIAEMAASKLIDPDNDSPMEYVNDALAAVGCEFAVEDRAA